MKVAVFGGTGKTGQHIVQQALDAEHKVNALARTPSKLASQNQNLTVIQGDILDYDNVAKTIHGTEAVISVLGPTENKPTYTISKGMDNILKAMTVHDVSRLIISAGAGIRDPNDNPKIIDRFFGFLLNIISKHVVADMEQVVAKVKTSDRNWTVVRVPMLTDQPAQETLIVGYVGDINPRISRADMASFMLKQLNDDTHFSQLPAISN